MNLTKQLILNSPLPPSTNKYLNYKISSRGKRKFVEAYSSHEAKRYESIFKPYVENQINEQKWTKPEKGKIVFLYLTFYMDRKKKDPNNFLKIPIDVLTKAGVWIDDDIVLPVCERVYLDSKNPRIEMRIVESDFIGIFENKEEHDSFVKFNCNECKKDESRCSIYKRALDNRILEEIEDSKCYKIQRKRDYF